MRSKLIIFAFLISLVGICMVPVSACPYVGITPGSTVFVGEEGLVLQEGVLAANDTQVAWYPSGALVTGMSDPGTTVTVNPLSFDVTPALFGSYVGAWYSYPNGVKEATPRLAFVVKKPEAKVKLWVYTSPAGKDATNYETVKGVKLGFRLETNMYPIFDRIGGTEHPGIDIYVEGPGGVTYSTLYDDAPLRHSVAITGLHPRTSITYVPVKSAATCVWDTGNSEYQPGEYTYYAYADVNGIKNTMGKILGDTFSLIAAGSTDPTYPTTSYQRRTSDETTPPPALLTQVNGTGTVTLYVTSGGILQVDTLLKDQGGVAYVSLKKGIRALNVKAQALKSLSLIMVNDPQNIGAFPDGQTPLFTYNISPEQSSFSPSVELGILIGDNSVFYNLYWWDVRVGKWHVVDAETGNDDGYLKADITKTGFFMVTYPTESMVPVSEPSFLPETTAPPAEPVVFPTPMQSPVGVLGIVAGLAACALLKKR
ncbi:DUF3821 domain-containing protein [Methanogenium marinum]|uniref:DUF3821 domain-containing protein n=1 Tax=Methanogenium marinum TaxID=348610 RepID=A0A9Q4KUB2_9EURY|nr:DUF3821 domain-containing protein [Methanogenium marinum]MDE4908899.1 DUF3821 domain-containing protein [Methanogenium marinum]